MNQEKDNLKTAGKLWGISLAPGLPTSPWCSESLQGAAAQIPRLKSWSLAPAERLYLKIIVCVCCNWSGAIWRTDIRNPALIP